MGDYEPGTVAVATVRAVKDVRVMRTTGSAGSDVFWVSDSFVKGSRSHAASDVTEVRTLVLLDLDDPNAYGCSAVKPDPAKIVSALRDTNSVAAHAIANQIEAQTKPPRIPEPRGLWAVVEASLSAKGYVWQWVHHPNGVWLNAEGDSAKWETFFDPTLIREGLS